MAILDMRRNECFHCEGILIKSEVRDKGKPPVGTDVHRSVPHASNVLAEKQRRISVLD